MRYTLLILLSVFLASSCSPEKEDPTTMLGTIMISNSPPPGPAKMARGTFSTYEHNLMGAAVLYTDSSGMKTLRLESFTMTEGPDVRVYLSKSNNYGKANVVEITRLGQGYNDSSFNFPVDVSSVTDDHKFVLVYCLQYNSLFGFAELR